MCGLAPGCLGSEPKDAAAEIKPGAISFAKGTSWRTKNWSYIRYPDGSEELYDMVNDPGQITNLASDSQHAGRLHQMAAGLESRLDGGGRKR